jgi:hypothetical protein
MPKGKKSTINKLLTINNDIANEFFRSLGASSKTLNYAPKDSDISVLVIQLDVDQKNRAKSNITHEIFITEDYISDNLIGLGWTHFGKESARYSSPKIKCDDTLDILKSLVASVNPKLSMLNLPNIDLVLDRGILNKRTLMMRFDYANSTEWVKILRSVSEIVNNTYVKEGYRAQVIKRIKELSK